MEIISAGIKPDDWWYEGTCTTCQTKVQYQHKEAKLDHDEYYVSCPVCSKFIYGKFKSKFKPSKPFSDQRDVQMNWMDR